MSKEIYYNEKYTVGHGLGSWAKSFETGINMGDVRVIGEVLMCAYTIYDRSWFKKPEVNWTPVDRKLSHDFEELKRWVERLA